MHRRLVQKKKSPGLDVKLAFVMTGAGLLVIFAFIMAVSSVGDRSRTQSASDPHTTGAVISATIARSTSVSNELVRVLSSNSLQGLSEPAVASSSPQKVGTTAAMVDAQTIATVPYGSVSLRAVSLRVLEKQLRAVPGRPSEQLLHLGGLTTLLGCVMDEESHDLILYGEVDSASTNALHLEDFLIALGNASFRYASRAGNTITYEHPGCSIDPNPSTMAKLQRIGQDIQTASGQETEKQIQQWHRACQEPQAVRVMGIPFQTRFADIMVTADYDMKRIVDGTYPVYLSGFQSLLSTKFSQATNAALRGRSGSGPSSSMNRFWFYPGTNRYEEGAGVFWVRECPVELLTEEMFVNRGGQFGGRQRSDPAAAEFARSFSRSYAGIAEQWPIYRDLENLFRFVVLAKVIKFKTLDTEAGFDLSALLDALPISSVSVPKTLPGRSAVLRFGATQEVQNATQIIQLWLPSCGGVGIDIDVKPGDFQRTFADQLAALKRELLEARPSLDAVSWDFEVRSPLLLASLNTGRHARSRTGLRARCRRDLQERSTPDMQLFTCWPVQDSWAFDFPDNQEIIVSAEELRVLKSGQALAATHPLSRKLSSLATGAFVMYSPEEVPPEALPPASDRRSLAMALQKSYPEARIFEDPFRADTAAKTRQLNGFVLRDTKDLIALLPDPADKSLQLSQAAATIRNIESELRKANVDVRVFAQGSRYDGGSGKAVFVITAHNDEALKRYVEAVGEAGYFKENYVIFNSCESPATSDLIDAINNRYKAAGTFSFEGRIAASAVQDYMVELAQSLKSLSGQEFARLLIRMVIKHKLTGIFTISKAQDQPMFLDFREG